MEGILREVSTGGDQKIKQHALINVLSAKVFGGGACLRTEDFLLSAISRHSFFA